MSYEIRFDDASGCVIVQYEGELRIEEIVEAAIEINQPIYDHLPRRLHDGRSIKGKIASADIHRLGGFAGSKFDDLSSALFAERRTAIIASGDFYYGFARMLTGLTDQSSRRLDETFRVFRSFDEAAEWLGLPPGFPGPLS